MSDAGIHGEWLSLLDVSGPFLALPVLKEAMPQGLAGLDADTRKIVRQAYAEWSEAFETEDEDRARIHDAWIELVLGTVLSYRDPTADFLKNGDGWNHYDAEHDVTLTPDYVLTDGQDKPLLLVAKYPQEISLEISSRSDRWAASPIERMVELCRATGVRLGLVTNGERWTLVDAGTGVTSIASWYARLWSQEPLTLQAFVDLLGIRRFFAGEGAALAGLLDKSLSLQDEVTDALGEQVRRAVEVLVQSLDRADQDRNRELLKDVTPAELYEAGLTIMMRIVFLLSAEERGLLLMGDETYEANYAVSTLRLQLRSEAEEILERRWDAWSRLLSLFRAIYAGIDHDALRLPALGGSLFDPDRFPFLEGRAKGSKWATDAAVPLPIDNRTVLLLLEAVQLFQGRALSYLALDVEQIGYVYEGLLERTVVRAAEPTLDLAATKSSDNPWVTLAELDDAAAKGDAAVQELLKERTGSSANRIKNALAEPIDEAASTKLIAACQADQDLKSRIAPYFHLLRTDSWGYPLVYPKGTFMVASGSDRRETGTHYTPKSFTESIVKTTLEPIVYDGPSQGAEVKDWKLKTPSELLDLKICDPAMGSGAFLVQVCRYLGERLVEAWNDAEVAGKAVSAEGEISDRIGGCEPMTTNPDERQTTAKRLIAERCLYGVDMNPLAVELAKLSLWLVTLAKGRPFGFLDHNLRSGDSLLGITSLDQLLYLDLKPSSSSTKRLFAVTIDQSVNAAVKLRTELRTRPIRDIRDVEVMAHLDEESRKLLRLPTFAADALVGAAFESGGQGIFTDLLTVDIGEALSGDVAKSESLKSHAEERLGKDLPSGRGTRRPLHWPLEFPEVFGTERGGFDAVVGNPPFLGDTRMKKALGGGYRSYITRFVSGGMKGKADLVVFFFLRAFGMLKNTGVLGLLGTDTMSHGDSRTIGLQQIVSSGGSIIRAKTRMKWPGKASVVVHQVHISKSQWSGKFVLDDKIVPKISSQLYSAEGWKPRTLNSNLGLVFEGTAPNGEGFVIPAEQAQAWLDRHPDYSDILFPYIIARQVNQNPAHSTDRWIINFWDWTEERSATYQVAYEWIENTVKPIRQRRDENGEFILRSPIPQKWWQHKEKRPALYHAIGRGKLFVSHPAGWRQSEPLPRALVMARGATKYPCFTLLDNTYIFGDSLCVIADASYATFGVLSSDIHAIWAWHEGGRKESRLRYTQESIFETFPFPSNVLAGTAEDITMHGKAFFESRKNYMRDFERPMTDFYNDFHDEDVCSERMVEMRNLQIRLNESVVAGYGFDDIDLAPGFHEVGYLPAGENVRFTIAESVRVDLLGRLALLNKGQYEQQDNAVSAKRAHHVADGELFAAERE